MLELPKCGISNGPFSRDLRDWKPDVIYDRKIGMGRSETGKGLT